MKVGWDHMRLTSKFFQHLVVVGDSFVGHIFFFFFFWITEG